MSQENVEIVLALQPGPGVDIVPRFRDEKVMAERIEPAALYFHPDVECVHRLLGVERAYFGSRWAV
jgi:hypothetical protein